MRASEITPESACRNPPHVFRYVRKPSASRLQDGQRGSVRGRVGGEKMPKKRGGDDVVRSDDAVAEQARSFDTPGTPWYAVKHGTLEDLMDIWPATRCARPHHAGVTADDPCELCGCRADVFDTGAVGENILHICVLFHTTETLRMARYLVLKFGAALVNAPYQQRRRVTDPPGLYEGETALHIAIVHRDAELVSFLLNHGARLDVHAIGTFFAPGRVYFGETPLAFAASTGATELVDILLKHAFDRGGKKLRDAVLNDADALGNTAAHMAVVNNRLDCYDHLVDQCGASESVENNAGLTPFLIAARDGNAHAFNRVLRRKFAAVWRFGPVTSYNLNLTGIDTVGARASDRPENAVDVLVRSHRIELLSHPVLVAVLDLKWRRFAKAAFLRHLACYAAFLALFAWLVAEHVGRRERSEWRSGRRIAAEWCCFAGVAAMSYLHVRDLRFYARKYYRSLKVRNGKSSDVPTYSLPGRGVDGRCNPRQRPVQVRWVGRRTRIGRDWTPGRGGPVPEPSDSTVVATVSTTSIDEEADFAATDADAKTPPGSPPPNSSKTLRKLASTRSIGRFRAFDAGQGGTGAESGDSARRKARRRGGFFGRMLSGSGGSVHSRSSNHFLFDSLGSTGCGGGGDDDGFAFGGVVDVRSAIARGRWRLLRERWMERNWPGVARKRLGLSHSLSRADDFDDRVVVLLRVNVLGARGLPAADANGASDPYCVVHAAPGVIARTQPVMETLEPLWHRSFSFTAPPGLRRSGNCVFLSVIDYDGYDEADEDGDDPLGFAAVPHHDVQYVGSGIAAPGPTWLDLMPTRREAESRALEHSRRSRAAESAAGAEGTSSSSPSSRPVGQILAEVYYEVVNKSKGGVHTDFYPRDEAAIDGNNQRRLVGPQPPLRKRLGALGYEVVGGDARAVLTGKTSDKNVADGFPFGEDGDGDGFGSDSGEEGEGEAETTVAEAVAEVRRAIKNSKRGARHAFLAIKCWITSVFVPQPLMWLNLAHLILHAFHFVDWNLSEAPSARDDVVFSLAALAAWGFFMYFVATSRRVGFFVVIVARCIKDVVKFSALWIIAMLAFSQAFYILGAGWLGDPALKPASFGAVAWKLFAVATAAEGFFDDVMPDTEVSSGGVEFTYTALVVAYQVLMSVLMLNVIIAMFNQTFSRVSDRSRDEWTLQWALKVLLAEARLEPVERFRHRLGAEVDGPGSERAQNFEINFAEGMLEKGSVEAAIRELLSEDPKR